MAFVPFTKDDQPTMAAFNEKFQQAIDAAVAAGMKIEKGSYIGTGTYGSSSKNSLTFGVEPKLVIIIPDNMTRANLGIFVLGVAKATTYLYGANSEVATLTWSSKNVSWYASDAYTQLNYKNKTYHYIAIGYEEVT